MRLRWQVTALIATIAAVVAVFVAADYGHLARQGLSCACATSSTPTYRVTGTLASPGGSTSWQPRHGQQPRLTFWSDLKRPDHRLTKAAALAIHRDGSFTVELPEGTFVATLGPSLAPELTPAAIQARSSCTATEHITVGTSPITGLVLHCAPQASVRS